MSDAPRGSHGSEELLALLTQAQPSLYAYLLSLVPDRTQAEDLLQETNLTLWRKADEFEPGTRFLAWACQIAYFKVLSHRRRMARDRHLFSDELLDYLAERQAERMEQSDPRREAMQHCLQRLPLAQRELIQARYRPGGSVQELAARSGRSVGAISQTLYRIRTALCECIRSTMFAEQVL